MNWDLIDRVAVCVFSLWRGYDLVRNLQKRKAEKKRLASLKRRLAFEKLFEESYTNATPVSNHYCADDERFERPPLLAPEPGIPLAKAVQPGGLRGSEPSD